MASQRTMAGVYFALTQKEPYGVFGAEGPVRYFTQSMDGWRGRKEKRMDGTVGRHGRMAWLDGVAGWPDWMEWQNGNGEGFRSFSTRKGMEGVRGRHRRGLGAEEGPLGWTERWPMVHGRRGQKVIGRKALGRKAEGRESKRTLGPTSARCANPTICKECARSGVSHKFLVGQ